MLSGQEKGSQEKRAVRWRRITQRIKLDRRHIHTYNWHTYKFKLDVGLWDNLSFLGNALALQGVLEKMDSEINLLLFTEISNFVKFPKNINVFSFKPTAPKSPQKAPGREIHLGQRNTSSCSEQSSCSFLGGWKRWGRPHNGKDNSKPTTSVHSVHSSAGQKESPGKAGSLWCVVVVSWPRELSVCTCVCVCVWISDNIVGKPQYIQAVCLTVSLAWCVGCVWCWMTILSAIISATQTKPPAKPNATRFSEPCVLFFKRNYYKTSSPQLYYNSDFPRKKCMLNLLTPVRMFKGSSSDKFFKLTF